VKVEPIDDRPLYRARVAAAIAPMHAEPRIASQMVSQQVAGHLVDIVDEEGEWARARGADDYEGWVHTGFLTRLNGADPASPCVVSLGCEVKLAAAGVRALPLRAHLRPDETVVDGEFVDAAEVRARFPLDAAAIAKSAREFFRGTSYLWGGVTPWGADCSGLTQTAFALHGFQLPRDAWQQAQVGEPVDGGIAATRPGDLLFFSDRPDKHVTHVGIALGGRGMVHLALGRGGYAVEQLDTAGDAYAAKLVERFLFAKRML
jgi:cell wall-associated NlpC family hydrolase